WRLITGILVRRITDILRPLERVWDSISGSLSEGNGSGLGGYFLNLSCE
ncbi:unnamed protein product, partial [marine sediment metagenome]